MDTDLVTIGIGYNDAGMISRLMGACLSSSDAAPDACETYAGWALEKDVSSIRHNVIGALTRVRKKARRATVILVGYLPMVDEPRACSPDLFTYANARRVLEAEQSIDSTLRKAATEAGTDYLSMRRPGQGHGACDGAAAGE